MNEVEWRPVPNAPGYEVSNTGRVRSIDRIVPVRGGTRGTQARRVGMELKQSTNSRGYKCISLVRGNRSKGISLVHTLVCEAFHGPKPEWATLVRHLNDVRTDNRSVNLAWGTRSDNAQDAIRNGLNPKVNNTTCPYGHEYDQHRSDGVGRQCGTCRRTSGRESERRRRERQAKRCKHCGREGSGMTPIRNQFWRDRIDGWKCTKPLPCIRRQEKLGQWTGARRFYRQDLDGTRWTISKRHRDGASTNGAWFLLTCEYREHRGSSWHASVDRAKAHADDLIDSFKARNIEAYRDEPETVSDDQLELGMTKDALVAAGVWPDDNSRWVVDDHLRVMAEPDRINPRIEIRITELEEL